MISWSTLKIAGTYRSLQTQGPTLQSISLNPSATKNCSQPNFAAYSWSTGVRWDSNRISHGKWITWRNTWVNLAKKSRVWRENTNVLKENICVRQFDRENIRGHGSGGATPRSHRKDHLVLSQRENLHQGYQVTDVWGKAQGEWDEVTEEWTAEWKNVPSGSSRLWLQWNDMHGYGSVIWGKKPRRLWVTWDLCPQVWDHVGGKHNNAPAVATGITRGWWAPRRPWKRATGRIKVCCKGSPLGAPTHPHSIHPVSVPGWDFDATWGLMLIPVKWVSEVPRGPPFQLLPLIYRGSDSTSPGIQVEAHSFGVEHLGRRPT